MARCSVSCAKYAALVVVTTMKCEREEFNKNPEVIFLSFGQLVVRFNHPFKMPEPSYYVSYAIVRVFVS